MLQFFDTFIGRLHAVVAFEVERLGHHTDSQNIVLTDRTRDHRRSAGSRTAAHTGGHKHHMASGEILENIVKRLFSRRTANFRTRAGTKALCDCRSKLDRAARLRLAQRLRIGVCDDEVNALQFGLDHIVDGVSAGAADADDGDPRFQLGLRFWHR